MAYRCKDCRKHVSVRTGTVLAESRLPLLKWLLAIFMLTSARKGIPGTQVARELGATQKTAWFLARRIRETWMGGGSAKMDGQVQVDETYVDGKEKNKHAGKKLKAGRGAIVRDNRLATPRSAITLSSSRTTRGLMLMGQQPAEGPRG